MKFKSLEEEQEWLDQDPSKLESIYDYRLSTGKKLGDATRADLLAECELHAKKEREHRMKGAILRTRARFG